VPTYEASTFTLYDLTDTTKKMRFACANLGTGVTLTLKTPPLTSSVGVTLGVLEFGQTWTALQTFRDTAFKLTDDIDPSKTVVFSLGGATANADLTLAWAGTADRTLTVPDVTSTLAALGLAQTWTAIQTFNSTTSAAIFKCDSASPIGIEVDNAETGFRTTVIPSTAATSDIQVVLPSGGGTLLTTGSINTITNKTLGSATKLSRTTVADANLTTTTTTNPIIAYTSISAARTVTLLAAATAGAGRVHIIKDESGSCSGANTITIDGNAAETIDGAATLALSTAYAVARIYCNGSAWFTF
jgi:hypothetical protein